MPLMLDETLNAFGQEFSFGPGPMNSLGVELDSSKYAQLTRGALARAEWADYLASYGPLEDEILRSVNNPAMRTQAMSNAQAYSAGQFRANDAAYRRDLASFGLSMTPGQEASYQRNQNIASGLSSLNAQNQTSLAIKDRDRQLIAGSGLSAGLNTLSKG